MAKAGIEKVIQDFDRYARQWHTRNNVIPIHIRNNILYEIEITNSVDTGRFLRALDFREEAYAEGYRYLIDSARDTEVTYDLVLELGRTDGANYPARHIYKKGIERTDLRGDFDDFADSSFAR